MTRFPMRGGEPLTAPRDPAREVQVVGPYNSGTNLMFKYQRRLFDTDSRIHKIFAKHSLPPDYRWGGKGCIWSPGAPVPLAKIRKVTLFLCMVRRPYFWLLSTCRRSYKISFLDGGKQFSDRIRSRIRFQDLTYESLMELWNVYYRAYEQHLEPHRTIYVRLEDLVGVPQAVLLDLHDHLVPNLEISMEELIEEISNTPAKKHGGECIHGEQAKREYSAEKVRERISPEDLAFINDRLDPRLMEKFRYPFEP
ncbi:MAG: hypothetical protein K0U98_18400 [Deltaproteobacteria bacterium]|nr:hypothetical protein [Deltaproteobacteria bacterium]